MLPPTIQEAIMNIVNSMPDDADITATQFFHLVGNNKAGVYKAMHRLVLKGHIVLDRTEPPKRGGQQINIYRKVVEPKNSFMPLLITEGPFADLFAVPHPVVGEVRSVRNLMADVED